MLKIAYSPVYKYTLPEGHRFPMLKYELIPEQLVYEGTVNEDQFFHPDQLTYQEMVLTHTEDFLNRLDRQELTPKEIRKIGFPMTEALIERGKYISKGTYSCARYAQQYGVAVNVAGGTHHSYADHGEGFCIYNDFAIASNLLLNRGEAKNILIVDLDVHQGNGTAHIFQNENRVFTFSMHGQKNYPTKKESSDLDIGIPDKAEDGYFLKQLRDVFPHLLDKVEPDFIFYLAGADVLESDKLGRLSMTLAGAKERDRYILESCKENNIPVAISMGGGYSDDVKIIVDAHANTFRLAQEIYF